MIISDINNDGKMRIGYTARPATHGNITTTPTEDGLVLTFPITFVCPKTHSVFIDNDCLTGQCKICQ